MKKRLIAIKVLVIVLGLVLIANSFVMKITGNVVSENVNFGNSILGILFVAVGIGLILSGEGGLEKTLAQRVLESGKMETKTKFLKKIAKKSGYVLAEEVKEGTAIYSPKGEYVTVIPRHREVSPGVYRSIIKALATGESSFRKRHY